MLREQHHRVGRFPLLFFGPTLRSGFLRSMFERPGGDLDVGVNLAAGYGKTFAGTTDK
jgi:hypothetical protein